MPDTTAQFRAALHGYNREDVVSYIDRMSREHEDTIRRLNESNDSLRAKLAEANESLASASDHREAEQALAVTRKVLFEREKSLNEAKALIGELRARNGELEEQVRTLTEELEEARTRVLPEPQPEPQDLDEPIPPVETVLPTPEPKPDYTELELAAYRRAELAERMARDRADEVYRQIQSVFGQASAKLNTSRTDLEQLRHVVVKDVNAVLTLLEGLDNVYQQAALSFGEIGERNRTILQEPEEDLD